MPEKQKRKEKDAWKSRQSKRKRKGGKQENKPRKGRRKSRMTRERHGTGRLAMLEKL